MLVGSPQESINLGKDSTQKIKVRHAGFGHKVGTEWARSQKKAKKNST